MTFINDRQRKFLFANKFARDEESLPLSIIMQQRYPMIPAEEWERAEQKAHEEVKWDIAGAKDIGHISTVLSPFGQGVADVEHSMQVLTPVGSWYYDSRDIALGYQKPYKQLIKSHQKQIEDAYRQKLNARNIEIGNAEKVGRVLEAQERSEEMRQEGMKEALKKMRKEKKDQGASYNRNGPEVIITP